MSKRYGRWLHYCFGVLIYGTTSAIGMNFFYRPLQIGSSGIQGVSQILVRLAENQFQIQLPMGLIFLLLNLPLIWISWRMIGKYFTVFTLFAVLVSALTLQLIPVTVVTQDPLTGVIFGASITGIGIGIALRFGVSSGGVDIIAILLRKRIRKDIGLLSSGINGGIILLSGFIFGWQTVLYTIIGAIISGKVVDEVFINQQKAQVLIVTQKAEKVTQQIHRELQRGVTVIKAVEGSYHREAKQILLTVVSKAELPQLELLVRMNDKESFLTITDHCEVVGNFVENEFS